MTVTGGHSPVYPAERAGWFTSPLRSLVTSPRRILGGLVTPGDAVADVGCGPGFFTLPLAKMVGPVGSVVAVDLQQAMLDRLWERTVRAGLQDRIRPRLCTADSLGLATPAGDDPAPVGPLDFALAFWMVHEVPDASRFFCEVREALKPGGRVLVVEPRGHVDEAAWERTLEEAAAAGLLPAGRPRVAFSRSALLEVGDRR